MKKLLIFILFFLSYISPVYADIIVDVDVNSAVDIAYGGTNATTATQALTNLGLTTNGKSLVTAADYAAMRALLDLEVGTDFNAYSAALNSLAGLTETNGGIPYGTADNAYAWLAAGAEGTLLMGNGAGAPSFLAAGATTTILVGGGAADPVWTTATGTGAPVRAGSPTFTTAVGLTSGNLTLGNGNLIIGTSGKGIDFSATADATGMSSELLDDYEEGFFNPTLTCSTSGSFGLDASVDTLSYKKVGGVVTVGGKIDITSDSSCSGTLRLSMPFTGESLAESADLFIGLIRLENGGSTLAGQTLVRMQAGSDVACHVLSDAGSLSNITHAEVDTAFSISVTITYFAD